MMRNIMSVLLLGSAFLQAESRKCFSCLNADYSGPAAGLLSLQKCADFNPENADIVRECQNSDRCYIASLDETFISQEGSFALSGDLHICSEAWLGVDFCDGREDGCYDQDLDYQDDYGSISGNVKICCCGSDLCNSPSNSDYQDLLF